MAKPGSDEARRLAGMARQAADLSGGDVPEALIPQMQLQAEGQMGMRCGGCTKRIGVGLQFTRIDYVMSEGKPTVDVLKLSACNGAEGCEYAAECAKGADVMEMIEFVWLNGEAPVGHGLSDAEQMQHAQNAVDGDLAAREPAQGVGPVADGAEYANLIAGDGVAAPAGDPPVESVNGSSAPSDG